MKEKDKMAERMTNALRDFARIMREEYNPNKSHTEILLRNCEDVFQEFGNTIDGNYVMVELINGKMKRTTSSTLDWNKKALWCYDNKVKIRILATH